MLWRLLLSLQDNLVIVVVSHRVLCMYVNNVEAMTALTCAGGQTNPEHLRQIYQAHLMLQLRVQEVGEYNQPEAIMTAARAVSFLWEDLG